jgi:hypothetical protein
VKSIIYRFFTFFGIFVRAIAVPPFLTSERAKHVRQGIGI